MDFFLQQLYLNFDKYADETAFVINDKHFSYADLALSIASIQQIVEQNRHNQYFAVVARNEIETFATIFGLWLMGKTSVPISPKVPEQRNRMILDEAEIDVVFDAGNSPMQFQNCKTIATRNIPEVDAKVQFLKVDTQTDLYLLFTSGSTGRPKGVRLSQANLDSYLHAFFACGYKIDETDRCIEVFELTFDASVQCYTFPLMKGAAVYTIPDEGVRFLSILKILQQYQITFIKMTPSVIYYLQPYFDRIQLPRLRYCLFGAEAFPADLVSEWEKSIPNAEIHNVYGPTEATINCTYYIWQRGEKNKVRNGIASIGKPYKNIAALVCDENLNEVDAGEKGELCISGPQITKGYLKRPQQNRSSFFVKEIGDKLIRFYKTGDLVIKDKEGDLLFVGRKDTQVQIDGHRIELGEIENHALQITNSKCVALVVEDQYLSKKIVLYVESESVSIESVLVHLRKEIPEYMIPANVYCIAQIPLLPSGKTDRQTLLKMVDHA